MGRKLGRPALAPRLLRKPFATTISGDHDVIVAELVKKGLVKSKAKYMDWVESLVRKELQKRGIELVALKTVRL
jgi:hypothetical protein